MKIREEDLRKAAPTPDHHIDFVLEDGAWVRLRAFQVAAIQGRPGGGAIVEAIIRDVRRTYRTKTDAVDLMEMHGSALAADGLLAEAV